LIENVARKGKTNVINSGQGEFIWCLWII